MSGPFDKLRARLFGTGGLKTRMIRATAWLAGQNMLTSMLRLGSNLITTRLLYPEAFGLMAILLMIQHACVMFTDLGISKNILREKDGDDPRFLGVLWTMQFGVLALVSLVMLGIAGLLRAVVGEMAPPDSVFADPVLPAMLAVAALGPLMQGCVTPAREVAMRNLDFRRIALFELFTYTLGLVAMLSLLYVYPSVWVLLFGILLQNFLQATLSHVVFRTPRVRPSFDREIMRKQWEFGRYILGSSPLQFFFMRGDRLLLGLLLDAKTFGIYAIAMIWVDALRTVMNRVTQRVGFAGIAEVNRTDPEGLARKFARYQRALTIINFGIAAVLCLGGPLLVSTLYSETYHEAGDYLAVLGLLFLFRRYFGAGGLLIAKGDSKVFMMLSLLRAIGLFVSVPVGYWLGGLSGALFAVAFAGAWSVPLTISRMARHMPAAYVRQEWLWMLGILAIFIAVWLIDPIG